MSNKPIIKDRPLEYTPKAIVVGASSGIGAETVRNLVEAGYAVAAVARREVNLSELCDDINRTTENGNGGEALYYIHNVTDFEATTPLFQQIVADLNGLDLIVYSAGAQTSMAIDEYNFEKDSLIVRVNLLGAMAWLNHAAHRFETAGSGHIVAISSISGDRGRILNPGYNASKAGLNTYLEGLRNRLSRHGVTVTTIKPGFVKTRLLELAPKTMWVITPTEAAEQILKAVKKKKQTVYIPGRWRYVGLIIQHIPSIIFRRMNF